MSRDGAERADVHLVATGRARSRSQAQRWIREGRVQAGALPVLRPAQPVPPDAELTVRLEDQDPVGRGAHKLRAALQTWTGHGLTVAGRRCLDVGASTGGFTQVLLGAGASHVSALDVGHGQLVAELAEDPRVVDLPGTNIRTVRPGDLGEPFDLVVVDVSFISLRQVLPVVAGLLAPGGDVVALVKPQFEAGRQAVGRGGIVRDPATRERVLHEVLDVALRHGLSASGLRRSPVTGTHGNQEYLVWLRPGLPGRMEPSGGQVRAQVGTLSREADS